MLTRRLRAPSAGGPKNSRLYISPALLGGPRLISRAAMACGGGTPWAVGFPTTCLAYFSSATGAWTQIDYTVPGYAGVEHYDGRFYVAFGATMDTRPRSSHSSSSSATTTSSRRSPSSAGGGAASWRRTWWSAAASVSVRNDGTVYDASGVAVDDAAASKKGDDARRVEVHRVEWVGDGDGDGAVVRLVREVDIGWRALFLGRNRAFALSAVKFPACRVNCVYLVDRQGHPDGVVRVLEIKSHWWARQEETIIFPDDGRRGPSSNGWALRGWFFPSY
ncbi:hypothetical protein HU200_007504 [Digitaria exilis]|uniref:KIB1-4 beta-propeller domain-containing protein n=1 Tax=Digitaria exilis TaxID=1010633 RepID=A0A835KSG3_9POAL|nr:hypothetical protein HU200_007504 [Digitaria exilis]